MHVFRTDGAAVSFIDTFDYFTQRGGLDAEQRAGVEHRVEIGLTQIVSAQGHLLDFRPRVHFERIETRAFVTLDAIRID